jgi:hypothetical protein
MATRTDFRRELRNFANPDPLARLGAPEVASLDRATEPGVSVAFGCHEHMFPRWASFLKFVWGT